MDKNIPEIKSAFVKNNRGVFLTFSFSQWKNDRVWRGYSVFMAGGMEKHTEIFPEDAMSTFL